jgi:hypothetical protein
MYFGLLPGNNGQGLAEVRLGMPWRMGEWHEHLLRTSALLAHVILDDGVAAGETLLFL